MKKILVTGANGDIGESVGRVLIEEFPDFQIHGSDCIGVLPGSFIFSKVISVPKASDPSYFDHVNKWIEEYDLIIPTSEDEIKIISKFYHKNKYFPFLILPDKILNIGFDKLETYNYLNSNNIEFSKTKLLKNINKNDLPLYSKPRFGAGGKGNKVLYNQYDLYSLKIVEKEEYIVQELLLGRDNEYTCVIYKDSNNIKILQLKRKLFGDRTGVAEVVKNKNIDNILLKIAQLFSFSGSLNVQLKLIGGMPKIFEINPRLSSTVMMRHKIGFKDCVWWVRNYFDYKNNINFDTIVGTKIFRMSNEKIYIPK